MSPFEALKRFFAPSDPTIATADDVFVVIDREKVIANLKLDDRAAANGTANLPPPGETAFDDAEAEIVAEIVEQAKRAHVDAQNHYRVYGKRLSELALLRELSAVTGASTEAISDFGAIVRQRKGRLTLARDAIAESYTELAEFKAEHGLRRTAHDGMKPLYVWSAILMALAVEAMLNTAFLRVNDDLGLVGGFVAALIVAGINIGSSSAVGRYWWPYIFHKSSARRNLAVAGSAGWFILLLLWNLAAAHYRDAKSSGMENPEYQAVVLLRTHWLDLSGITSYGLLAAGIVFGLLSAYVAFRMDDPYPGYGAIYRRHEDRCEEYADEIEDALEELKSTRDDANQKAEEIRAHLGAQFRERSTIISSRETLYSNYVSHLNYLEETANALLDYYRTANRKARSEAAPTHFNQRWKLERAALPTPEPEPSIDAEVQRAQESLAQSIRDVTAAYDAAVPQFEHLDEIKRALRDG